MSDTQAAAEGTRRRGLRFRLFGIPIRIGLSFPLVLLFLGWQLRDPAFIAIFVLVGGISVLVHELGHALAARALGMQPQVQLAGMGGLTSYRAEVSRSQQLAITAAGPALQIIGGLVGFAFTRRLGLYADASLPRFALDVWVLVSLLWGGLNLVPMLPLDGGQLLRDLLPLKRPRRVFVAHVISIGMAAVALGWALLNGDTWIALLAGLFGWMNIQALSSSRQASQASQVPVADAQTVMARAEQLLASSDPRGWLLMRRAITAPGPLAVRSVAASRIVEQLLRDGRASDAYMAVRDQRHDLRLDEVVIGRALAGHPNTVGVRQVLMAWARERNDARARGIVVVALASSGRWDDARDWAAVGPLPEAVDQWLAQHVQPDAPPAPS